MKALFDQGTPLPLRRHLIGNFVRTAWEEGWSDLDNGDLPDAAEQEGFEVLITTDQNMRYQQNLTGRNLAVLVLLSTAWPKIQLKTDEIREALSELQPGDFKEVPI